MPFVLITGNTYPVKDQLKALGGKWNKDAKGWEVPAEKADEAKVLVANAAGAPQTASTQQQSQRPRFSKCQVCGVRASRYVRRTQDGLLTPVIVPGSLRIDDRPFRPAIAL